MDINDIIDEQVDAAAESTLESEIDALSKIITDTKDGATKSDDDDDFKLDSDDITFTASSQSSTPDDIGILSNCDEFIPTAASNAKAIANKTSKSTESTEENTKKEDDKIEEQKTILDGSDECAATYIQDSENELSTDTKKYSANNSLSLINEAYTLQESQSCLDNLFEAETENEIESTLHTNENKDLNISENIKNLDNLNNVNTETPIDPESKTEQTENNRIESSESISKSENCSIFSNERQIELSPEKDSSAVDDQPKINENQEISNTEFSKDDDESKTGNVESNTENLQENKPSIEDSKLSEENVDNEAASLVDNDCLENVSDGIETKNLPEELAEVGSKPIVEQSIESDITSLKGNDDLESIDDIIKTENLSENVSTLTSESENKKEESLKLDDKLDNDNLSNENLQADESSINISQEATKNIDTSKSSLTEEEFESFEENIDSDGIAEILHVDKTKSDKLIDSTAENLENINTDESKHLEEKELPELLTITTENISKEKDDIKNENIECKTEEDMDTGVDQLDNDVKEIQESSQLSKETEDSAFVDNVDNENIESIEMNSNQTVENIESVPNLEEEKNAKVSVETTENTENLDVKVDVSIETQQKLESSEEKKEINEPLENVTSLGDTSSGIDLQPESNIDEQASEIEEKEEFFDCTDSIETSEKINVNIESIDKLEQPTPSEIENVKNKSSDDDDKNLQESQLSDNIEKAQNILVTETEENSQTAVTDSILENVNESSSIPELENKEDVEAMEDNENDDMVLQIESTDDNESKESSHTEILSADVTEIEKETPLVLDEESKDTPETDNLTKDILQDEKSSQLTGQIESTEITAEEENTDVLEDLPECKESITESNESSKFEENETSDDIENKIISEAPEVEVSESETAVKFLQESEEQDIEAAKMEEATTTVMDSSVFVSVEDDMCDNIFSSDVPEASCDPIAISEAEIISEAAKLEIEKEKLELKLQTESEVEESSDVDSMEMSALPVSDDLISTQQLSETNVPASSSQDTLTIPIKPEIKLVSKSLPKAAVLEDRYKEPPQIEIPDASSQIIDLPSDTLKTSQMAPEEDVSRQRTSSPDRPATSSTEPKITDTPKKDADKQSQSQPQPAPYLECENVGSPRIILKIAKSAIADCSEPRSPKSPKIRSATNSPNPEDSPSHKLGKIKLKLSKGGHPSIIPSSDSGYDETAQWHTEASATLTVHGGVKIKLAKTTDADKEEDEIKEKHKQKHKEQKETTQEIKKQDSLGMKIKLSKSGDASIIQQDSKLIEEQKEVKVKDKVMEDVQEGTRRTESPLGMKIKLSKTGDASIITNENLEESREKLDVEISKKSKTKDRLELEESDADVTDESAKITNKGVKIKLPKTIEGRKDDETSKKPIEQPLGMMKIKLSKTGEPSIIHSETPKETEDVMHSFKTKHSKKDHGSPSHQKSKDDSHPDLKIKISKTGHPTIITSEPQEESSKSPALTQSLKHKDLLSFKDSSINELKKSHSDVTIEPIANQSMENTMKDLHNKRKEITIAPIESKKSKLESSIKQMLPDITIQPIAKKEPSQKLLIESKSGSISQQQMNVINQEISITQVCSLSSGESLMGEHLKSTVHAEPPTASPLNSDCEIIENQPELIIVNENSNSSQDVMIIDEVPPPILNRSMKVPKKRGRPRRVTGAIHSMVNTTPNLVPAQFQDHELARDPLSLDQPSDLALHQSMSMQLHHQQSLQVQQLQLPPGHVSAAGAGEGSERPRRTCRSQKSYAPPKRGRGRGRGKRKYEALDISLKKSRIEQDLTEIEKSTTAVIAIEKLPIEVSSKSPELFKALSQPMLQRADVHHSEVEITPIPSVAPILPACQPITVVPPPQEMEPQEEEEEELELTKSNEMLMETSESQSEVPVASELTDHQAEVTFKPIEDINVDKTNIIDIKVTLESEKQEEICDSVKEASLVAQEPQNWLAPSIKKISAEPTPMTTPRTESISTLTVMDEETRMSAESGSRSQTPARNVPVPGAPEVLAANEESQGSVLSTATTESEKVKVKSRRMEITLDPDEGPFTVDKIAEYEWPIISKEERPAGRGETFMIQEQISQYLGVKSFKRKYPDLKRRMVDMEERNYLRENGLVSEAMCDMGLTAVSSSEVLDIMCSDFPEQYEEYRKHMREKAAKEHSKKQKELSAAANAERNRIDLAEMAMQSALAWNVGLNRARQDTRKCSLDLQTFTVHVPIKRAPQVNGHRNNEQAKRTGNHYPVAVIPGQYAEYYREYTPSELRYYPLNTVLYGPMRPNERKFDSQSEGSQSDSDSDSSSDDSSSSSSEGTQDTEGSQSTMDEVDMELAAQSDVKCKMCLNNLNKSNRPETLIQCGTCNGNVHPSCIDLTIDMVPHIRAYAWQCTDCKNCAQCHDPADEDKMLFCDMCDRGYHIYCVGLRRVPQGRWHCQECAVCANCGSKEPGGANSDRNSVAQWQHEYKKGDKNTRVYVSTFCVPCSKLWRKGRYCPHCSRCHNAPRLDLEPNLVHCGACDKYLHLDCVETKGVTIDKKNYLCDFCSPNRQQLMKPLVSKTFKT